MHPELVAHRSNWTQTSSLTLQQSRKPDLLLPLHLNPTCPASQFILNASPPLLETLVFLTSSRPHPLTPTYTQVVLLLCERQQGPGHGPIQLPRDLHAQLSKSANGAELDAIWFKPLDAAEEEQLRRAAETLKRRVELMRQSEIRLPVM
jgi:hypothetical protein